MPPNAVLNALISQFFIQRLNKISVESLKVFFPAFNTVKKVINDENVARNVEIFIKLHHFEKEIGSRRTQLAFLHKK